MAIPNIIDAIKNPSELASLLAVQPALIGSFPTGIPVDVLRSETKIAEWDLTEFPIEAGLTATNARIKRPVTVRLEGILTDASWAPQDIANNLTRGLGSFFQKASDKKAALESLAQSNELIQISTKLDFYFNMMITALTIEQTPDTSSAIFFTLEAREVKIIYSTLVDIDPSMVPKDLRNKAQERHKNGSAKKSKTKDLGNKTGKELTGPESQGRKSLLYQAFEGLGINL